MYRNHENALCYGCLCSGRNQLIISDYLMKQCFSQILQEIPMSIPEEETVALCWQCHTLLDKFTKFKEQVKSSYLLAHEYVLKDTTCASRGSADGLRTREGHEHVGRNLTKAILITHNTPMLQNPDLLNSKHESNLTLVVLESYSIGNLNPESESDIKVECDESDDTKINALQIVKDDDDTFHEDGKEPMESYTQSDEESLQTVIENHRTTVKKKKKKSKTSKCYAVFNLSEAELEAERAVVADSVALKESAHVCRPCLAVFSDEDRLARHLHDKHQRWRAVLCEVCGCGFEDVPAMAAHRARHYRRYMCAAPACALVLRTRRAALGHFTAAHGHDTAAHAHVTAAHAHVTAAQAHDTAEHASDGAPSALSGESEMTTHSSAPPLGLALPPDNDQPAAPRYKSTEEFPCDKCEKRFKWKTSLRKHAELHRIQAGEKQGPYCRHCRISFTSKSSLNKHIKSSSKHLFHLKVQKLKEAGGGAGDGETGPERERQLREIKQTIAQALSKHRCPHCDKSFQWKGNLLRHIQSHVAKARGELECAQCSKTFASIATYQQHVRTSRQHAPAAPPRFSCEQCAARFATKARLRDHVHWDHLHLRNYRCPHCQKAFKSNTSLYLHRQAVHRQDARVHLCDHCGRPFPGKAKLRSHIAAVHSGTQPYRCALCPAAFSWHSCLSRHNKLVHRKKRPAAQADTAP